MRTLSGEILGVALMALLTRAVPASEATLVEMREFAFRPAIIRVQAGRPVTLLLVNRGQIAHQFETNALRGLAVTVMDTGMHIETSDVDLLRLQPGASALVSFVPRSRGRFRFACTIEGHREAGMVGVLEVY